MRSGLIPHTAVEQALSVQQKGAGGTTGPKRPLFGTVLCHLGLISPFELYHFLSVNNKLVSLQEALITRHGVKRELIEECEKLSEELKVPFVSCLLDRNAVSVKTIQSALFRLFHLRYKTLGDFAVRPKSFDFFRTVVRAKEAERTGMLPLVLKGGTLLIGITDVSCMGLIRNKTALYPDLVIKAVVIHNRDFKRLYQQIYGPILSSGRTRLHDCETETYGRRENFVCISDPVNEKDKVYALYRQYRDMGGFNGAEPDDKDFSLFLAFICNNVEHLKSEYGFASVKFAVERHDEKTLIKASQGSREGRCSG